MKKLIIYLLMLFILVSFVSAGYSTDRTDYYWDLTNYLTDGIQDGIGGDIAIDSNTPIDNNNCDDFGWTAGDASKWTYQDTDKSYGSLGMYYNTAGNDWGSIYYDMPDNSTFTGSIGFMVKISIAEPNFYVKLGAIRFGGDGTDTEYKVYDVGWTGTGKTINTSGKWYYWLLNYTGSAVNWYVNGSFIGTHATTLLGRVDLFSEDGGGDFEVWVDEFFISNNDRPEAGAGGGGNFSIIARSSYDNSLINNFSAWVDGDLYNTSTGTITTGVLSNSTSLSNINISSVGYFNRSYLNYNVSTDLVSLLDPINSISITIRNEETNNLIYDNTSIKFQNNQSENTYYTNTSALFLSALDSGQYYITFDVLNETLSYTQKSYVVTMSNSSTLILNAYLTQNSSTTTFTVSDRATSGLLENVLATSYKMINNSWVSVESGYTGITGQVSFLYLPYTRYKYYLAKDGYENYIFYLNPVQSSTYTINMDRITQINESQDYDQIALIYAPFLFYDGRDNNFTFLIQSPYGELIEYGYDLTFPGGTASNSGSNSIGSQLYNNFTITGANVYDRVKVEYYYETGLAGRRDFTYYYSIVVEEAQGNNTMITIKDKTYGLGLFERIFLAVFIVVLVVGIATLIGQPIPGMGLGMLIYGILAYIGFIPLWSILISLTLGLIIIGSRPGG